jgi:hypothetical protein
MTAPVVSSSSQDSVTVIVVAICSVPQLRRSLAALKDMEGAVKPQIVVAADSRFENVSALQPEFPDVVFLQEKGRDTPIELTVLGLHASVGDTIVLTEDSCVAHRDWLLEILRAPRDGKAAIGGVVQPMPGISPAMWAFCFVDFFRYMSPLAEGASPTLSVCNVSYRAADLKSVADKWTGGFHETFIHDSLRAKFGPLWLTPRAQVYVRRDVAFDDAVYERYAFGRLFGATRIVSQSLSKRLLYVAAGPLLPVLLMWRMVSKARQDSALMRDFRTALPAILMMVFAWSWGEWTGYLTGRRPRRITTAPEIDRSRAS